MVGMNKIGKADEIIPIHEGQEEYGWDTLRTVSQSVPWTLSHEKSISVRATRKLMNM
jgi:hypothetical protein